MAVERSRRVVEGFTETAPTEVGQYLIACSETDYKTSRVSVMKVVDELYVKDPDIGGLPLFHYDLIDLLWKRVPPACDMRGCVISIGDTVAYGKSSRYDPIAIGEVKEVNSDNLLVMGRGNSKGGYISNFSRVIVLPDEYISNVECSM